jgi:hypothetical protein
VPKVSALAQTAPADADVFYLVKAGVSRKTTLAQVVAALPWATVHGYGTTAAKPAAAAGNAGWLYFDTDLEKFQRSNGTAWEDIGGAGGVGDLIAANNLSDLENAATARDNLGLGDAATLDVGSAPGTVAPGDHAHAGYAPLASPTFTGPITFAGSHIIPTYAITGGAVQTNQRIGGLALTGPVTLSFSATPTAGSLFAALLHADGTDRTVTVPSSKSFARGATITSFIVPANGSAHVVWYWDGTTYHIYGDPVTPAQVKAALSITAGDVSGLATVATTGAAANVSGLAPIATSGSASDLTAGTVGLARLGAGSALQVARRNAANNALEFVDPSVGGGSGDVTSAANIADNAIARGDGGTKGIQGSTPTINDAGEIEINADSVPGYVGLLDAHATAPKLLLRTAPTTLTTDQTYIEPATGGSVGMVKRVASLAGDVRTEEWVLQGSATPQTISSAGAVNATSGVVICTGTSYTITLPAANAAAPNAMLISIINAATGDIIIDPAGSETIEGETTATLQPGNRFTLASNNSNAWYLV